MSELEVAAEIGYTAYGDAADWKAYDGKPMPQWADLPIHIRARWCAATRAIEAYTLQGAELAERGRLGCATENTESKGE